MKGKRLLKLVSAICLAALIAIPFATGCAAPAPVPAPAPAPVEEVFNWDWQTHASPTVKQFKSLADEFKRLSEVSGGRLNITLHPGGSIVPDPEAFAAIRKGVLQGSTGFLSYLQAEDPGYTPLFQMFPGLFTERWEALAWFYEFGGYQLAKESLAKIGLVYLPPTLPVCPPEAIHSNKSLATLDDFKGLKIRSLPGPSTEILRAMGATVMSIPGSEIYSALDTGIIDAAEYDTIVNNFVLGYQEVTKYFLYPAPHNLVGARDNTVGMDAWNSLPSDLQGLLVMAIHEYNGLEVPREQPYYAMAVKSFVDYGTVHQQLSDEDWAKVKELGRELAIEWMKKSPLSEVIITSQIDALKAMGRW